MLSATPPDTKKVVDRLGRGDGVLFVAVVLPHTDRKEFPPVFTLSWLLVIALIGGILALIDGIRRLRGRGTSIVGIIEVVVAALFLLSLFLPGIPFGSLVLGIVTLVVLVVALIVRGRTGLSITIAAIVLIVLWLILVNRWLVIPGIN